MHIFFSWINNVDEAQYTDIHYRSLTGEGNFNWRMVFSVKYNKSEDMVRYFLFSFNEFFLI